MRQDAIDDDHSSAGKCCSPKVEQNFLAITIRPAVQDIADIEYCSIPNWLCVKEVLH